MHEYVPPVELSKSASCTGRYVRVILARCEMADINYQIAYCTGYVIDGGLGSQATNELQIQLSWRQT